MRWRASQTTGQKKSTYENVKMIWKTRTSWQKLSRISCTKNKSGQRRQWRKHRKRFVCYLANPDDFLKIFESDTGVPKLSPHRRRHRSSARIAKTSVELKTPIRRFPRQRCSTRGKGSILPPLPSPPPDPRPRPPTQTRHAVSGMAQGGPGLAQAFGAPHRQRGARSCDIAELRRVSFRLTHMLYPPTFDADHDASGKSCPPCGHSSLPDANARYSFAPYPLCRSSLTTHRSGARRARIGSRRQNCPTAGRGLVAQTAAEWKAYLSLATVSKTLTTRHATASCHKLASTWCTWWSQPCAQPLMLGHPDAFFQWCTLPRDCFMAHLSGLVGDTARSYARKQWQRGKYRPG